ncbi:hypothetical protein [Ottowia sp. SB7-C50]|uniref:hypothetical protein n=1 Tax=Ottowia sp. SB7-C50 TaxID=3081231 RepID=UPI002952CE1F|nr:hypothetical protein [Ottowia sp. SB7-C50]WOP16955.1 hypothetical protein R0D99_08260 [Ottowia sp. SB7-C50]
MREFEIKKGDVLHLKARAGDAAWAHWLEYKLIIDGKTVVMAPLKPGEEYKFPRAIFPKTVQCTGFHSVGSTSRILASQDSLTRTGDGRYTIGYKDSHPDGHFGNFFLDVSIVDVGPYSMLDPAVEASLLKKDAIEPSVYDDYEYEILCTNGVIEATLFITLIDNLIPTNSKWRAEDEHVWGSPVNGLARFLGSPDLLLSTGLGSAVHVLNDFKNVAEKRTVGEGFKTDAIETGTFPIGDFKWECLKKKKI